LTMSIQKVAFWKLFLQFHKLVLPFRNTYDKILIRRDVKRMTFGEKIKALRLERGMTLEQVGDIVGVGKSTVRKWESGQIANMRRDKIALLAKALGVTPGYLMGWEPMNEIRAERDASIESKIGTTLNKQSGGNVTQAREELADDPDRRALLNLARYGSAQDVKQVAALIDALRATNPDFYDGDDPA